MKKFPFAILASCLAVIVFAGLMLGARRFLAPVRLDFTANKLYTLSPSATSVVDRLVEPVDLELVYSREVAAEFPLVRAHGERVREMLDEIAARSNGRVRVSETDPEPLSAEEDRVTAAGLSPAPTDAGEPLYFGVIGRNSVDDRISIPFLAPERDALLEYDLVRLIAQLDDPQPRRIALLSSLPGFSAEPGGQGESFILKEMRRAFEVELVDPDFRSLPANTDILMLVHPPALNDWQTYVVDQFLLAKGRALIAVDPVSRVGIASQSPSALPASTLGRLGEMLGVSMGPEAVADKTLALPVAVDAGGGRMVNMGQPLFIAPNASLMAKDDPITADLSRPINFGAAGDLVFKADAAHEALISTSPQAGSVAFDVAAPNPPPRVVEEAIQPPQGARVIAARISGPLKTLFPQGRPPPALPEDPTLAKLAEAEIAKAPKQILQSTTPAEVVVISDADVLDDGFYINPSDGQHVADNAAFILNALDTLSGDPALVALRSRAPALRPMARIDDMRAEATMRLAAQQTQLEGQLAESEARLKQLEAKRVAEGGAGLRRLERSSAETEEIERFRAQANATRQRLREVEREFRRDINALASQVELFNIWLPPLLAVMIGAGVAMVRGRSRERVS